MAKFKDIDAWIGPNIKTVYDDHLKDRETESARF